MGVDVDNNGDLLKELRIERSHRDDDDAPRRWPWIIVAVVVLLAIVLGGGWWWTQARALTVQVVAVIAPSTNNTQGAVLQATGYVTARREATVSAQIVGTLTSVRIEEGDHVKQGQILATLNSSSQQAQLNSAKAGVLNARATLNELSIEAAQAVREAKRQNTLVAEHLVSAQQAQQATTKVADLQAQITAQRAQVKMALAQQNMAQVNYDYTFVRAPFAGVVTQKSAQVGEIVAPSAAGGGFTVTGIATIVDMNSLEVDVDVNEAYISRVKPNMPATAVLDAYPDWKIPAHVIAIVPTADKGKATVKVRVALDHKDARIIPNMGVRVTFLEATRKQVTAVPKGVLVPASAIVERGHRQVVFEVHGNKAEAVNVTPAQQTYGDMKLLPHGVAAGTEVVATPPAKLAGGMRVKVTTTSP
ncbi:MAG TPA: efflux RND transporter periplasmic adaptor subunit [Rhodanobacteraceae bacterium]